MDLIDVGRGRSRLDTSTKRPSRHPMKTSNEKTAQWRTSTRGVDAHPSRRQYTLILNTHDKNCAPERKWRAGGPPEAHRARSAAGPLCAKRGDAGSRLSVRGRFELFEHTLGYTPPSARDRPLASFPRASITPAAPRCRGHHTRLSRCRFRRERCHHTESSSTPTFRTPRITLSQPGRSTRALAGARAEHALLLIESAPAI